MTTLEDEIKALIVEALDLEDLKPEDIVTDDPLFGDGLGLDSIDALELGIALRKKYGLQLKEGDSGNRDHFRSVTTLAALILAQGKEAR